MPNLKCIACDAESNPTTPVYTCAKCGALLDVVYDLKSLDAESLKLAILPFITKSLNNLSN